MAICTSLLSSPVAVHSAACSRQRSSLRALPPTAARCPGFVAPCNPLRQSRTLRSSQPRRSLLCQAAAAGDLAALKEKFDVAGNVEVAEGTGGLTKVVLTHSTGSSAEVYLFGGCVISWKQPSGDEVLYVRPDAKFDGSKPISGGIPHCFPQFGPGPMQQHGFARNSVWEIGSTSADLQPDEPEPAVELVLTDSEYTRTMWPHAFKAVFTVTLHGEKLRTDLRVLNTGDAPFDFTAALHSYFEVLDIGKAKVSGLAGLTYLDKVADPNSPVKKTEDRDAIMFDGPMDSVYLDAPEHVQLDVGTGAAVAIDAKGWPDVVVWNPHTDMDCYKSFCCVENASFKPQSVAPGESWRAQTEMEVVDLV